jgi:hypothetical protein
VLFLSLKHILLNVEIIYSLSVGLARRFGGKSWKNALTLFFFPTSWDDHEVVREGMIGQKGKSLESVIICNLAWGIAVSFLV